MLCVQPSFMPANIIRETGSMPTASACTVSLILPFCSSKVTVVTDRRSGSSFSSRAIGAASYDACSQLIIHGVP